MRIVEPFFSARKKRCSRHPNVYWLCRRVSLVIKRVNRPRMGPIIFDIFLLLYFSFRYDENLLYFVHRDDIYGNSL